MKKLNLKIGGKILALNGLAIGLLAVSLLYIYHALGQATSAIEVQRSALSRLETVVTTSKTFAELRYWMTDLAVSWQNESESNADTAKEELEKLFKQLEGENKELVQSLRPEVESFYKYMIESVDAYVDENRVIGNSLVADGRNNAILINSKLNELLLESQAAANAEGEKVIESNIAIRKMSLILIAGVTIAVTLISLLFSRSLTRPLRRLMVSMEDIAKGDLKQDKLLVKSSDEIGVLSKIFNTMLDSMRQIVSQAEDIASGNLDKKYDLKGDLADAFDKMKHQLRERSVIVERDQLQARELKDKVDNMLGVVEAAGKGDLTQEITVKGEDTIGRMGVGLSKFLLGLREDISEIAKTAETLGSSSEELNSVSQVIAGNAEETSSQANVVANVSEQINNNVNTVATAVEQMSASIKEISQNAQMATQVANSAMKVAEGTNLTVAKLGESGAEIGHVIKVITSIAEKTNLLALNATIEAARAGEAGKGFAVVATEVKELANQTAKATEDIRKKIEAIQENTGSSVEAISEITMVINQINDISSTIASAVEEQAATTEEMFRSVSETAKGSSEISQNISGVAQAAQDTSSGVGQTQEAANELSRMASDLQNLVGKFQY